MVWGYTQTETNTIHHRRQYEVVLTAFHHASSTPRLHHQSLLGFRTFKGPFDFVCMRSHKSFPVMSMPGSPDSMPVACSRPACATHRGTSTFFVSHTFTPTYVTSPRTAPSTNMSMILVGNSRTPMPPTSNSPKQGKPSILLQERKDWLCSEEGDDAYAPTSPASTRSKSLVAPSSRARLNPRSSENHRRTPDNAQPVRVPGASELARPKAPFGTAKTTNKRACWTHLNCGKVLDCCSFQPALQMAS